MTTAAPTQKFSSIDEKFKAAVEIGKEFRHFFTPETRQWLDIFSKEMDAKKEKIGNDAALQGMKATYAKTVDEAIKSLGRRQSMKP